MAANLTKPEPMRRNAPVRFDVTVGGTEIAGINKTEVGHMLSTLEPGESLTVTRSR